MRYIKLFEEKEFKQEFKKDDLIISESFYNDDVFLVLKDADKNDDKVETFFIGHIYNQNKRFDISFNIDFADKWLKKNWQLRKLTEKEKEMVINEMKNDYAKKYLDIIKNKTGIDLKNLPELREWKRNKSVKNYSL